MVGSPDMPSISPLGAEQPVVTPEQQGVPDVKLAMKDTMDRLETKNQEFGGQLFATFGGSVLNGAGEKALVFPTPIRKAEGSPRVRNIDNFLMVTADGFRVIKVDSGINTADSRKNAEKILVDVIADRINKGARGETSSPNYGVMVDGSGISLGAEVYFSADGSGFITREKMHDSVKLESDVNPDQVAEIVKANLDRVQLLEAQKRETEERTKTQITAAQKINELLG